LLGSPEAEHTWVAGCLEDIENRQAEIDEIRRDQGQDGKRHQGGGSGWGEEGAIVGKL